MKILDVLIAGMADGFVSVDTDNVMNKKQWIKFCKSAVERNITQDELEKELSDIMGIKE